MLCAGDGLLDGRRPVLFSDGVEGLLNPRWEGLRLGRLNMDDVEVSRPPMYVTLGTFVLMAGIGKLGLEATVLVSSRWGVICCRLAGLLCKLCMEDCLLSSRRPV